MLLYAFLETQTISMTTKTTLSEVVATNVRAEMAAQGKSVAALATCLDVKYGAALARKKGSTPFSLTEVEKVARWLGMSEHALLTPRLTAVAA